MKSEDEEETKDEEKRGMQRMPAATDKREEGQLLALFLPSFTLGPLFSAVKSSLRIDGSTIETRVVLLTESCLDAVDVVFILSLQKNAQKLIYQ